jgi:sRNA-binding regulator protein Hfq
VRVFQNPIQKGFNMANKNVKSQTPAKWGTSAAAFFARHEDERLKIHLTGAAKILTGSLVGVDQYDIFIEREDGVVVLVCKHAIQHIEPFGF